MAIFSPIILLAQNTSSNINTNLQDSENMLQNANQELSVLKDQYNSMLNQSPETSFFNFGNLYFWLVLVGLLLLAFGLLFLLAELQNKEKVKRSKVIEKKEEPEDVIEEEVREDEEETELDQESEEEKVEEELEDEEQDFDEDEDEEGEELPKKKSSKPIKIKVQKIK